MTRKYTGGMCENILNARKKGKENRRPATKAMQPNHSRKLRLWSNKAMLGAMKAAKEGRMGVNRAGLKLGVLEPEEGARGKGGEETRERAKAAPEGAGES